MTVILHVLYLSLSLSQILHTIDRLTPSTEETLTPADTRLSGPSLMSPPATPRYHDNSIRGRQKSPMTPDYKKWQDNSESRYTPLFLSSISLSSLSSLYPSSCSVYTCTCSYMIIYMCSCTYVLLYCITLMIHSY